MFGTLRGFLGGLISALGGGYTLTHTLHVGSIAPQEWLILGLTGGGLAVVTLSVRQAWGGWQLVLAEKIHGSRQIASLGSLRDALFTLVVHLVILSVNTAEMTRHSTYDAPGWIGYALLSLMATGTSWARRRDRRLIWEHAHRNELTRAQLIAQLQERGISLPPTDYPEAPPTNPPSPPYP
jgi:hypothetical protein